MATLARALAWMLPAPGASDEAIRTATPTPLIATSRAGRGTVTHGCSVGHLVARLALGLALLLGMTAAVAGTWQAVGTGDCPGRDVAGSSGPQPDGAKCSAGFNGYTAVCWSQGCTYKNLPTAACTGGANPGRMYTCQAEVPPPAGRGWQSVGTGDCPGRDVAGSSGSQPEGAKCTAAFAGFTAVCWSQGCTYKNLPTAACTGGANPGRMYTCLPAAPASGGTGGAPAGSGPGGTAAGSGTQAPAPGAGQHYRVVNHTGDVRNRHDFQIDWNGCKVTEFNDQTRQGTETITVSVCRPGQRLVMRTDFRATGYWIQYDWVLLDDGATLAGSYRDGGSCGPSVGQRVK